MANIQTYSNTKRKRPALVRRALDTLDYLTPATGSAGLSRADILTPLRAPGATTSKTAAADGLETLNKRARVKYLQTDWLKALAALDSPLKKNYTFALRCAQDITQDGQKLKAKYCGNRFCLICNRIRTGKLINGYGAQLDALEDKRFITLTRPNVKADSLKAEINEMYTIWRKITRRAVKAKMNFRGIRKLEVTYNPARDNYHPHFHIIIEGEGAGNWLLAQWLEYSPISSIQAQDHREAHDPRELFKYCTKMLSKASNLPGASSFFYPVQMDVIFTALKNARTFQPFGGIRMISEDIETERALISDHVNAEDSGVWNWQGEGWYNVETGEALTTYTPTDREKEYRKRIRITTPKKNPPPAGWEPPPDTIPYRCKQLSNFFE